MRGQKVIVVRRRLVVSGSYVDRYSLQHRSHNQNLNGKSEDVDCGVTE
jgi:hypothetical protein